MVDQSFGVERAMLPFIPRGRHRGTWHFREKPAFAKVGVKAGLSLEMRECKMSMRCARKRETPPGTALAESNDRFAKRGER
jgi:hypothetical protein